MNAADLLSEDEVLKLPYYARGRKPGRSVTGSTLFKHKKYGLLTPDGTRVYLRGVRLAGGTFFAGQMWIPSGVP